MGGETRHGRLDPLHSQGLSPRGRGNRTGASASRRPARSIPAWAGKPHIALKHLTVPVVYPRVGGETAQVFDRAIISEGLSPRGRGNQYFLTSHQP